MPEWAIIAVTALVLLGITVFMIGAMVAHIQKERRASNLRRVWANFALSLTFCALFLLSWVAQAIAEWGEYRDTQRTHGEPASVSDYLVQFGQSTLENWQSEFLQLFAFVVLSALFIHHGSAESRDSDDRMERKLDEIKRRLDEMDTARSR